jgi:hypothetical protein
MPAIAPPGLVVAFNACWEVPVPLAPLPGKPVWNCRADPMSTAAAPVVPARSRNSRRLCRSGLRRRAGRLDGANPSTVAVEARARSCIAGEVAPGTRVVMSGAPLSRLAHPDGPPPVLTVRHGGRAEFGNGHDASVPARTGQSGSAGLPRVSRLDASVGGAERRRAIGVAATTATTVASSSAPNIARPSPIGMPESHSPRVV